MEKLLRKGSMNTNASNMRAREGELVYTATHKSCPINAIQQVVHKSNVA